MLSQGNRAVSAYGTLSGACDSREYFLTKLTQRKYFEGYQGVPDRRHNTMPWIVKKELEDEVSYVLGRDIEFYTNIGRYESICKALGYSDEFFKRTRHLHSISPTSPEFNDGEDSDSEGSTSRSTSFYSARQSTIRTSKRRRATWADMTTSSPSTRSQSPASPRTERRIPDRSAKPSGDPDNPGRRKPPYNQEGVTELTVSTSLGEGAPSTQSTKRTLPESPTSARQPHHTTRRKQHMRNKSSSEGLDSPL